MEELIFRTKVESGKSVKETEELEDAISGVGSAAEEAGEKGAAALAKLNKETQEGAHSFEHANELVAKYIEISRVAGEETPVGQEAIRIAKELAEAIEHIGTVSADTAAHSGNLEASLATSETLVQGYGAIAGAQAAVGIESEALTESMEKLEGVEALLVGIEQVRAGLSKEGVVLTKAKVIWSKAATAAEYIYALAVGTTTGAMKALRIAMLAIPLIAIIALIVAAVAALASFFSAAEVAEDINNKLNASFERQTELLEANERAFRRNAKNKRDLMVSQNATADELFEAEKERLEGEEVLRKKNLKTLKAIIPVKTLAYKQALAEENWELAKTIREETKAMRDKYAGFRELDGQYAIDRQILENKRRNEIAKEAEQEEKERAQRGRTYAKKAADRRAAEAKTRLEEQRLFEDLLVENIEDSEDRQLAKLKLANKRELEEIKTKYGENSKVVAEAEAKQLTEYYALLETFRVARDRANDAEELKKRQNEQTAAEAARRSEKARLEGKLIQMREDAEAVLEIEKELALFVMEQALAQENATEGEKFKIRQEYAEKIDALNAQVVDKEKQRQKDLAEATRTTTEMGLDAAQGLADAFFDWKIGKAEEGSKAELEAEKKKFAINKKLQIAQAIMQGIQSVQAAYSSGSAIPIVGAVTGPAFAAAAGIAAALNVAKIKNTSFSGGGSGSVASAATPSVSIPTVQGQTEDNSTTTETQGLEDTSTVTSQVVILQSELDLSFAENEEVSIVSNVG